MAQTNCQMHDVRYKDHMLGGKTGFVKILLEPFPALPRKTNSDNRETYP